MKHLVLTLMLAVTVTACSGGRDSSVRCPDDPNQEMSRAEWRACFGRQDKDGKGAK
jgi:hypothetical protein